MLLACFIAACTSREQIVGLAEFENGDRLPPGAHLELTLQDVSVQDVAAITLFKVRVDGPLHSPVLFEIPYDRSRIEERHRYSLNARIYDDASLLLTTDTIVDPFGQNLVKNVQLVLVPAGEFKSELLATIPVDLPSSFEGVLPCADCPGISTRLTLNANGSFAMRSEYLDREPTGNEDESGRWSYDENRQQIKLVGSGPRIRYYRVIDSESLRMLNTDGQDIASALNYELRKTSN